MRKKQSTKDVLPQTQQQIKPQTSMNAKRTVERVNIRPISSGKNIPPLEFSKRESIPDAQKFINNYTNESDDYPKPAPRQKIQAYRLKSQDGGATFIKLHSPPSHRQRVSKRQYRQVD